MRSRRPPSGDFYPRSPCGERRNVVDTTVCEFGISIHALLAESDPSAAHAAKATTLFLSTLSLRRATETYVVMEATKVISIHALLAESDIVQGFFNFFSVKFLSTLSLRRATTMSSGTDPGWIDFYPRSPCGERQEAGTDAATELLISIHALLAESDPYRCALQVLHRYFYPRSPCGERHNNFAQRVPVLEISIHALLAESDAIKIKHPQNASYFYPRSPCGERRP